jgi:hypothetical protein
VLSWIAIRGAGRQLPTRSSRYPGAHQRARGSSAAVDRARQGRRSSATGYWGRRARRGFMVGNGLGFRGDGPPPRKRYRTCQGMDRVQGGRCLPLPSLLGSGRPHGRSSSILCMGPRLTSFSQPTAHSFSGCVGVAHTTYTGWRNHLGAKAFAGLNAGETEPSCLQRFIARRAQASDDRSAATGNRSGLETGSIRPACFTISVHQLIPAIASTPSFLHHQNRGFDFMTSENQLKHDLPRVRKTIGSFV